MDKAASRIRLQSRYQFLVILYWLNLSNFSFPTVCFSTYHTRFRGLQSLMLMVQPIHSSGKVRQ